LSDDTARALAYQEKARTGFEELVQLDAANTQWRSSLAICYSRAGDLHLRRGDAAQALGYYEKALAVDEELVKLVPGKTEFVRNLAVSHGKLGQFRQAQGSDEREAAIIHYRKAVTIFEGMRSDGSLAPAEEEYMELLRAVIQELGTL
jgi:tetratricopeptide (TPR) repeat protein